MTKSTLSITGASGAAITTPFYRVSQKDRESIRQIQSLVNIMNPGARLRVDGFIGPNTTKAIRALSEDGRALIAMLAISRGYSVKEILRPQTDNRFDESKVKVDTLIPNIDVSTEAGKRRYINEVVRPVAQAVSRRYGLLEEGVAGQMILESDWGRATSGIPHNYGGIKHAALKSNGYKGPYGIARISTHEHLDGRRKKINDDFATFSSVEEFIQAFGWYLTESPGGKKRYRKGYQNTDSRRSHRRGEPVPMDLVDAKTALEYAEVLYLGGYATEPAYYGYDTKTGRMRPGMFGVPGAAYSYTSRLA